MCAPPTAGNVNKLFKRDLERPACISILMIMEAEVLINDSGLFIGDLYTRSTTGRPVNDITEQMVRATINLQHLDTMTNHVVSGAEAGVSGGHHPLSAESHQNELHSHLPRL